MWDVQHLRVQHNKLLRDLGAQMDKAATKIGARAQRMAFDTTAVRHVSGLGAAGWKYRVVASRGGSTLFFGNRTRYMAYQETGTGLFGPKGAKYPIEARRAKSLHFLTRSGESVFRKRVMHPGVRAKYIGRASLMGMRAPFFGENHSHNVSTIERELQSATR